MASILEKVSHDNDDMVLETLLGTITSLHAEIRDLISSTDAVSKTVSSLLTDPNLYIDNTPGFLRENWNAFRRAVENDNFEGQEEDGIAAFKSAIGKWKELDEELKDAQRPLELAGMRMDAWKGCLRDVQDNLGREEREERERRQRGEEKCWEFCQACGGGDEDNSRPDLEMP